MGLDVRLLTAFGDDVYAQKLAAVCGELGIDISQSPVIPGGHTSTYLFINDQRGDMQLAVARHGHLRESHPGCWPAAANCWTAARWWCWTPTSRRRASAWVAENCKAPIFADSGLHR